LNETSFNKRDLKPYRDGFKFYWHINNGFHSFTDIKCARYLIESMPNNSVRSIYSGIIPKGSNYISGQGSEIVSNQIIIKAKINE
jgi:hypothetical protein